MKIELLELIEQLRAELSAAMQAGQGKDLQFALGPVDVELSVAVEKAGSSGMKLKFWIVEAGGDAKLGSTAVQKIKLTLEPQLPREPGRRPHISGSELPGEDSDRGLAP